MRRRGLEPPRYFVFSHKHLKLACLPIPPPALCLEFNFYSKYCEFTIYSADCTSVDGVASTVLLDSVVITFLAFSLRRYFLPTASLR